jgi:hypothetical protein
MNRDEISNLYRGPSKDAPYQVSIHLAKQFQRRRFFRNQPIRNKNGLWRPCLLTDQDEISNLYRGSAIDTSYQMSVHLAKRFQRRRLKCEKLTDDRRRTPSDGKSSHCLGQSELKIKKNNFTNGWTVFNTIHINISMYNGNQFCLVEETRVHKEKHWPPARHWSLSTEQFSATNYFLREWLCLLYTRKSCWAGFLTRQACWAGIFTRQTRWAGFFY